MKTNKITIQGYEILKKQLLWLKTIKCPQIISVIKKNKKNRYLLKNIRYKAALESIKICNFKIKEIEKKIFNSHIIDIKKKNKTKIVLFSSTVILKNINNKKILQYKIVGDDEANIKLNTISISSPLATILIYKKIGEVIELNTYLNTIFYKIIDIKYV